MQVANWLQMLKRAWSIRLSSLPVSCPASKSRSHHRDGDFKTPHGLFAARLSGPSLDEHLALDEGMRSSADDGSPVPLFAPFLTLDARPRLSINVLTFNPNLSDWIMGWLIGWTDPTRPVMA